MKYVLGRDVGSYTTMLSDGGFTQSINLDEATMFDSVVEAMRAIQQYAQSRAWTWDVTALYEVEEVPEPRRRVVRTLG